MSASDWIAVIVLGIVIATSFVVGYLPIILRKRKRHWVGDTLVISGKRYTIVTSTNTTITVDRPIEWGGSHTQVSHDKPR